MIPRALTAAVVLASVCAVRAQPAPEPGPSVHLSRRDVDGDGAEDIVLENRLLRVSMTTGARPAEGISKRQGTRFVWGGWILDMTFLPTGRSWFRDNPRNNFYGIPEEFEVAVRTRETAPNTYECLKIGVGLCSGTGHCLRNQLTLMDAGDWTTTINDTDDGGKTVTVIHRAAAPGEWSYMYRKAMTLRPGSSRLEIRRELVNTGDHDLATTWYTHAFWGQSMDDGGYDDHCWATIPVKPLLGDAADADTRPITISKPERGFYWGSIDSRALAETWYACGHRDRGDLFVSQFGTPLAWYRVWTYATTYSCEPFADIVLAPGRSRTWTTTRACVAGMPSVRAPREGAVLAWQVRARGDAEAEITVRVAPYRAHRNVDVRVVVGADAAAPGVTRRVPAAGPDSPGVVQAVVPAWEGRRPVRVSAQVGTFMLADATRRVAVEPAADRTVPSADRGQALIIADPDPDSPADEPRVDMAADYLRDYLARAGFQPVILAGPDALAVLSAGTVPLAVLTRPGHVSTDLVGRLEENTRAGGGLLYCGPLDLRPFEFSELLPVSRVLAAVALPASANPRDGTMEFRGLSDRRFHLRRTGDHPATDELPMFPEAFQNIARLQMVEEREGASVLLGYVTGTGAHPIVSSPALVAQPYGDGRVAVFSSPVDWGGPRHHITWRRLGEYHRQMFTQLALWLTDSD